MPAEVGDVAPDFTLPSVSEGDITLSSYRGEKHVVLSFHVFDFTVWLNHAGHFLPPGHRPVRREECPGTGHQLRPR